MTTPPPLPLSIMESWSPEQKLAVYDLCRIMSEILWQHDRDSLLEAMIRKDNERGIQQVYDLNNPNLELPFDDDPPF